MTSRFSFLLGLAWLIAFAGPAAGQEPLQALGDTKIQVTGELRPAWRIVPDEIDQVLSRDSASDGEDLWTLDAKLNLSARVSSRLVAVAELDLLPLEADLGNTSTWGLGGEQRILGAEPPEFTLGQAYLQLSGLVLPDLHLRAGLQDLRLELRGDGDAFFLDMREAEFAGVSPVTEGFIGARYAYQIPEGTDPGSAGLFRDTGHPGGIRVSYHLGGMSFIDLVVFQTKSPRGGSANRETFYAVNLDAVFEGLKNRPGLFTAIVSQIVNSESRLRVVDVGLGTDILLRPRKAEAEMYAEFHRQFGRYGRVDGRRVDHRAYGYFVGGAYRWTKVKLRPKIDLSFWYLSGDDGETRGRRVRNRDFVSYEDVDSLLLVEDNHWGLDIDSNYWGPKLRAGIETSLRRKRDLEVDLVLGTMWLARKPEEAGLVVGQPKRSLGRKLGHEVDLVVRHAVTDSLDLRVGAAGLFSANFLESRDGFNASDNAMALLFLEVTLRF